MNWRRNPDSRPAAGFTLIELLVVIAIISLLMAILLPVLRKARESAQTIQCAPNVRLIGAAIFSYGGDFKGFLPGANWIGAGYDPAATSGAATGWAPTNWPLHAREYLGAAHATTAAEVNTTARIMQCPTTFAPNANMSYGINRWAAAKANVNQWRWSREAPRTLNDWLVVKYSSKFLISGESTYNNQITSEPSSWAQALNKVKTLHGDLLAGIDHFSRLHLDRRNFLLADGHVETQPKDGNKYVISEAATTVTTPQGKGKIAWGRNDGDWDDIRLP